MSIAKHKAGMDEVAIFKEQLKNLLRRQRQLIEQWERTGAKPNTDESLGYYIRKETKMATDKKWQAAKRAAKEFGGKPADYM